MSMVLPQVLYDSLFHRFRSTLTNTGSGGDIDGFESINAMDWRDFTLFEAPAGATILRIKIGSLSELLNTVCVWWLPYSGTAFLYFDIAGPGGVTWSQIASMVAGVDGGMKWIDFPDETISADGYLRVVIVTDAPIRFRQISAGKKLQFPVGQWAGISPPNLYQGVVTTNIVAVNGSIIGRNVRRLEKRGKLDINLLDPSWVRDYFDPFNRHAGRYPFWYRWHPVGYPTEMAFAAADEIVAPTNERPSPKMRIEMPMRLLT